MDIMWHISGKEQVCWQVSVGRINTPELSGADLEEDKVDMVVIGRGQLADLNSATRQIRKREDIVTCVGCDQGCYDGFSNLDMPTSHNKSEKSGGGTYLETNLKSWFL